MKIQEEQYFLSIQNSGIYHFLKFFGKLIISEMTAMAFLPLSKRINVRVE